MLQNCGKISAEIETRKPKRTDIYNKSDPTIIILLRQEMVNEGYPLSSGILGGSKQFSVFSKVIELGPII